MSRILARVLSIIITLASTPSVAGELDDLIGTLQQIDMHVADTGFQVDKNKYSFGSRSELMEDTTLDMGIGGKVKDTSESALSNSYRGHDSQTNMLEQDADLRTASPMLGMRLSHRF